MDDLPITARTRARRHPERASYDRATLEAILDAGWLVHVGLVSEGTAFVIPTTYVRIAGAIYIHGAVANRTLRAGVAGAEICATVTLLDGLVLARSAFHHSMNYRSVVIIGRAREVTDAAEKERVLAALLERLVPGRGREARPPSVAELKQTLVLELPLEEASAKVRVGPPLDDEGDLTRPIWAGVIPLALQAGPPIPAEGALGVPPARTLASAPSSSPPSPSWPGPVSDATPPSGAVVHQSRHGDYQLSDDRARVDFARVTSWLESAYWCPQIPRAAVERAARCSSLVMGAYAPDGQQVGYLRVVSDCTRFANIMDVFVAPSHRGRGLGRAMVRFALGHPEHRGVAKWCLGTRDAHGVYEREGFRPLAEPERFMERVAPVSWSVG